MVNKKYVVYLSPTDNYDLSKLGNNIDFTYIYTDRPIDKKYQLEDLAVKLIEGHRLIVLANTVDTRFIIGMWVSIHGFNSLIYYHDKRFNVLAQLPKTNYLFLFSPIFDINNLDENKFNMYLGYCANNKVLKQDVYRYSNLLDFVNKYSYYTYSETFIRYRRFILDYNFW